MIKKQTTTQRGNQGEDIACKYLEKKGFHICVRNYANKHGIKRGEIDIVASKNDVIHFVEVKTRLMKYGGYNELPEANITRSKLCALARIAEIYLREHGLENKEYHFDAVSIVIDQKIRNAKIKYLQDIFL